jgi:ATP-dependent Lon protease
MESCIANRLNNLCVLYCNLEKQVNNYLSKNQNDLLIKEELDKIKRELEEIKKKEENNLTIEKELKSLKEENNLLLKEKLEEIKIIKNEKNYNIQDELNSIKNMINSITNELRYQKNINLDSQNYLEYTLLYADFENCDICMYCPSEPYEPEYYTQSVPIIDNEKYTILKNILNN